MATCKHLGGEARRSLKQRGEPWGGCNPAQQSARQRTHARTHARQAMVLATTPQCAHERVRERRGRLLRRLGARSAHKQGSECTRGEGREGQRAKARRSSESVAPRVGRTNGAALGDLLTSSPAQQQFWLSHRSLLPCGSCSGSGSGFLLFGDAVPRLLRCARSGRT